MLSPQPAGPDVQSLLEIAASSLRIGDPARAVSIYRQLLPFDRGNPDLVYSLAVAEHQLGRYAEAEVVLRAGLSRFSRDMRFPFLLGRNFKAHGKLEDAAEWYRRALEIDPGSVEVMVSLGIVLWRMRRFDEAEQVLGEARALRPQSFEVVANLGNAQFEGGRHEDALRTYQEALALRPESADTHNNMGRALLALERKEEARASFEHALGIAPNHAETLYNRGKLMLGDGDVEGAALSFAKAVEQNATYVDGYVALAKVLFDVGGFDRALHYLDMAIRLRPEDPEGHTWRGLILRERGEFAGALKSFARVVELKPDSPDGYALQGSTHWILGEYEKASEAGRQASLRDPDYPPVLNLQGNLAIGLGRVADALAWYEKAISVDPGFADAHDNMLFVSNYHDGFDAQRLAQLHRDWGKRVVDFPPISQAGVVLENGRKLRVGFISPDFRVHSVAYFVEPLFTHLDRSKFDLYLYSCDRRIDATTKRLSECAVKWTIITAIGDEPVARMIATDGIDILVDLAGHTSGNRLGVLAHRPAPVQATWLGYPTSTGLAAIRYRITDGVVDPTEEENLNTELPVRLPASYFCYGAPTDAPDVGPLPSASTGRIAFGSFNNIAKISLAAIRLWARVLEAVPGSTLLVKNRSVSDEIVRREMRERFRDAGTDPERVLFSDWQATTGSHLALYGQIDIALDSYPYNGATTTCEALWMGVPTISLCGQTHASRMGASILTAAAHPEFIARSETEFVALATGLAQDLDALATLRSNLREKMRASPLMAHEQFTRDFEAILSGLMTPRNEQAGN